VTPFAGISHASRRRIPYPVPSPLALCCAVLPRDLLSSRVINSQFSVSIFDLTKKLALVAPDWGC
jgi:hypothetical protein